MTLDYFYGNQSEMFTFYRIPKLLFTDPELKNISTEAKVLYGLLLDRMSLSIKNNWMDEQSRVFIIFTIDEIMEALACAEQKAAKLLNELEKGVGLIERKRQGLGKPNLIYVKNFVDKSTVPVRPCIESQILNCENHNSGNAIITDQELPESQTNNTEINNTDSSDTEINPIPSSLVQRLRQKDSMRSDLMEERNRTREYLEEQLEIEILKAGHPYDTRELDEIFEILLDTLCSNKKTIRISGDEKPIEVVKSVFMHFPISFVIKTRLSKERVLTDMEQYIAHRSSGMAVLEERYHKAIEEIITINELQAWTEELNDSDVDGIIRDIDAYRTGLRLDQRQRNPQWNCGGGNGAHPQFQP